jgi:hypothetical protein
MRREKTDNIYVSKKEADVLSDFYAFVEDYDLETIWDILDSVAHKDDYLGDEIKIIYEED